MTQTAPRSCQLPIVCDASRRHCRGGRESVTTLTPRVANGRSARISDGNGGSRLRPDAAVNSHVLSRIQPELGNRYT
jgi:hypothetical protein